MSTMTFLVIVALVAIVVVVVAQRTRNTPLGFPGVPLEVLQEQLRMRATSGAGTSTSIPSSPPSDKEETVYSCTVGIPSKTDDKRLALLKSFGIGIYEAYLLGGLRLPLNVFARELLIRLGLGVCQFNPNA